ncbi:hypothetical protein WNY59_09625 [Ahrensia kielensis]|uniref:site-specific DNA-methyltransferase (adenine-specific) n=1 Tax=Ahrensia kielensis TaxID=76980 RepID=A0ABU9T6U5_9HYPH
MSINLSFQGTLFSNDFITQSITEVADWKSIDDAALNEFAVNLKAIFEKFPTNQKPNETRTEDDLIWKILGCLGWNAFMRQQNLSVKGRDDVPDGVLFSSGEEKEKADTFTEEYKRYEFGVAIVESKRWKRPLDRRTEKKGEELAPSTQMLRYLRRVDDITSGKLRWGILTNGGRWRLYWSGARSVSEQFFDIDLATILGVDDQGDLLGPKSDEERLHVLKLFLLLFRREAFIPGADGRSFHQRAVDEGRYYEERVANDLSDLVFNQIYPLLARSIAHAEPKADLEEVREAALILLYRLLFILYAEDRDLLPVKDKRYDDYGLRLRVREDVGNRVDQKDVFSNTQPRYWNQLDGLCGAIDKGDPSIGLPPYNGGLFDAVRTPLLTKIRLADTVMAEVIDKLSYERKAGEEKRYINYRDLSVQQLGSIYERLLEHEVVREGGLVDIRPNIFARKGSGSYYTPDSLVGLIIEETIAPLIEEHTIAFHAKSEELSKDEVTVTSRKLAALKKLDPAEAILNLKICDPAMGSGHFLVSLVDYMTDKVIEGIAAVGSIVDWTEDDATYISPLAARVDAIRDTIIDNAETEGWTVDAEQLDDRHIIRRMVLKRCVYGVDKNPMAVELAKVALWLHSFTVGAPLSFLDHHLHCGDSLFGSWVSKGRELASIYGLPALLDKPMKEAIGSAASMQQIEQLADAEIAEAHKSAQIYEGVRSMVEPLDCFLKFVHALQWLDVRGKNNKAALQAYFDGEYGDPFMIAAGRDNPRRPGQAKEEMAMRGQMTQTEKLDRFLSIWNKARQLIEEERFTNWQVTFPGLWTDWNADKLSGGFDAIIGNPPWDRIKLQQVEWFAARRREIALAQRASDRKAMITALKTGDDPLAKDFAKASGRAEATAKVARKSDDYPLLSGGDINLYSLFVERAMKLVKPEGIVGLLTPSGIASDKTSSVFFKGVATEGRLKSLYDFENRRTRYDAPPFFPDVDSRFKFCAFIASPARKFEAAYCSFFLQSVIELNNPDRRFPLTAEDFARVNPNTGTAPIFRTRRDAELTTHIYANSQVLVDRSSGKEVRACPVKYSTMFHMTDDSGLFRTRIELDDKEAAWPIGSNSFGSASGDWVPLYEGKMVQAYDHRAANILVNPKNQHRPAQPEPATHAQHSDVEWVPAPQFWVNTKEIESINKGYFLAFKDVTATTNVRSMIAAIVPFSGLGNTLPAILPEVGKEAEFSTWVAVGLANLNSIGFDFIARQKIQGQHLNWYIVEQLPVIPPDNYDTVRFGPKSAGEVVREAVLELTYTANDMAPFARDLDYVDNDGNVKPPFKWDEERRLHLRAKLDAIFFHLYGITDRDDVRYIYSTFPIVERHENAEYGTFRSRDLCLSYMNALSAGKPDAVVKG